MEPVRRHRTGILCIMRGRLCFSWKFVLHPLVDPQVTENLFDLRVDLGDIDENSLLADL